MKENPYETPALPSVETGVKADGEEQVVAPPTPAEALQMQREAKQLVKIARAQRELCWTVLICVIIGGGVAFLRAQSGEFTLLAFVLVGVASLLQMVGGYRLVLHLKNSQADAVLSAIIYAAPVLGLLMMFNDSGKATARLKPHVKVGAMGVSDKELARLEQLAGISKSKR